MYDNNVAYNIVYMIELVHGRNWHGIDLCIAFTIGVVEDMIIML